MTRILENLDIPDGHDVLEIGTGTGYNAKPRPQLRRDADVDR